MQTSRSPLSAARARSWFPVSHLSLRCGISGLFKTREREVWVEKYAHRQVLRHERRRLVWIPRCCTPADIHEHGRVVDIRFVHTLKSGDFACLTDAFRPLEINSLPLVGVMATALLSYQINILLPQIARGKFNGLVVTKYTHQHPQRLSSYYLGKLHSPR
jgi:hypothetical protein